MDKNIDVFISYQWDVKVIYSDEFYSYLILKETLIISKQFYYWVKS